MNHWKTTPAGLLVPVQTKSWPRPAGWAKLPADVRAAWDARWQRVKTA